MCVWKPLEMEESKGNPQYMWKDWGEWWWIMHWLLRKKYKFLHSLSIVFFEAEVLVVWLGGCGCLAYLWCSRTTFNSFWHAYRFLTYAFLPVFNTWLMICPYCLSYDWQMGSIPLVESLWDVRNLYSAMFYSFYFGLIHQSFNKVSSFITHNVFYTYVHYPQWILQINE